MNATAVRHPSGHWIVFSHADAWMTTVPDDDMGDFIAGFRSLYGGDLTLARP